MRFVLGIVMGMGLVLAGVRSAEACGFWSLADKERGISVGYHINSATITKAKKRLGALYLDVENKSGMRVVKDKQVVFDIKAGKVRKRGKAIATVDGGTIMFGRTKYTIELSNPTTVHEMATWELTVKKGDTVIIESKEASSLCAGMHRDPPMTEDDKQDEVRRRVILYLAWRETGN